MTPTVLVIGSSQTDDPAVPRVRDAIAARGARVVWVDSTRMPLGVDLSYGPDPADGFLRTEADAVALADVTAVWMRHTHVAAGVWELLDPDYAPVIKTQTVSALWDVLGALDHCLHVDRIGALQALPGPVAMLNRARRAGFAVPRTLVSNDVDRVAAFLDSCPGGAIRKMLDSSAMKVPRPDGTLDYLPTQRVTEADRAHLDRVALCPMVFQEDVQKRVELRVTVVGADSSPVRSTRPAARPDAPTGGRTPTSWVRSDPGTWSPASRRPSAG